MQALLHKLVNPWSGSRLNWAVLDGTPCDTEKTVWPAKVLVTALSEPSLTRKRPGVRAPQRPRQVRAKVHARRGRHAEAERLAREAVAACEKTEMVDAQGDVYADLAEVLLLAGGADEAAGALEQALARYERKGKRGHGRADA